MSHSKWCTIPVLRTCELRRWNQLCWADTGIKRLVTRRLFTTSAGMAHSRKRSGTLQSLLTPSTPKLSDGQTKALTLWVNDNITDRVVLNHESWPGVSVGDVIQVQSSTSAARGEDLSNFCFVVGQDEGHRHGALQVSHSRERIESWADTR